jgi:hypothetical protein
VSVPDAGIAGAVAVQAGEAVHASQVVDAVAHAWSRSRVMAAADLRRHGGEGGIVLLGPDSAARVLRNAAAPLRAAWQPAWRSVAFARRGLDGLRLAGPALGWGLDAGIAAARAAGWSITVLDEEPAPAAVRRALRTRPATAFVALAPAIAAAAAARLGLPGGVADIPVLAPILDPARLGRTRAVHRQRWGATDRTLTVGLVGDPPDSTDARRAADLVGIAAIDGLDLRLVVHPAAARRAATVRWLASVGAPPFVVADPLIATPWTLAGALDVVLVLRDGLTTAGAAARAGGGGPGCPVGSAAVIGSPLPALWSALGGAALLVEAGTALAGWDERLVAGSIDPSDFLSGTRILRRWCLDPGERSAAGERGRAAAASLTAPEGALPAWRARLK